MLNKFEQTMAITRKLYTENIVPGISVAFIDGNKITKKYIGQTSWMYDSSAINEESLYDIASLTKVVATTTLILKLLERNIIPNIDTPIQNFLPEFNNNKITFRHILTHTSGIRGYIPNRDKLSKDELINALLNLPVTNEFLKVIRYTDTGLIYCGLIFEKIYQKPAQQILMEEVIEPLQLKNTSFTPDVSKSIPTELTEKILIKGIVHDPKARILGEHCASAGLFSNLDDLTEFSKFMLGMSDLKDAPISITSVDWLYQEFTNINPGRSLGWDIRRSLDDGHVILFHTGFTGTFILLDKKNKTGMILLTNRVHPHKNNRLFLKYRDYIVESFLDENKQ